MQTCPCDVDPLTPHFYIVKLGFTGVFIFSSFCSKKRLWVLVRTATLSFEQKYEDSQKISTENYHFYSREISMYVAWACSRNMIETDANKKHREPLQQLRPETFSNKLLGA